MIRLDLTHASSFLNKGEMEVLASQAEEARMRLLTRSGAGSEFLGWLDLPIDYDKEEFARIEKAAEKIRANSDVLVVVGIGGSYLGARAVIEALSPSFISAEKRKAMNIPEIVFAGQQLSASYLADLLDYLDGKRVSVNVISKSGTTTEPALAFRFIKAYMEKRYSAQECAERIYATTDRAKGALKALADQMGYECFVVPDDVGGRYSVLTAVGLLPIAAAGLSARDLLEGAAEIRALGAQADDLALRYAMARSLFYRRGYKVEILANFEPALHSLNEWWKQLYGESEGKDGKGIFPAAVDFSTDLHSMGQYIQDGSRVIFETFLKVEEARRDLSAPLDPRDGDGLNFLAGIPVAEINHRALAATLIAHEDGGTPAILLTIRKLDERHLGALLYFFEKACGISAYLNGVNPFDQPGVEAYKKNMFALLGKPGYEELRAELEQRL